jgi:hypothetical protein
MRYKSLVTRKLEELDNIILGLKSLFSSNASREQIENQFQKSKEKIAKSQ